MRVCDRCKASTVVAVYEDQATGTAVDLCAQCATEFFEWIAMNGTKKTLRKPGRPPKSKEGET